jgi:AcrR family transcriptional regulator
MRDYDKLACHKQVNIIIKISMKSSTVNRVNNGGENRRSQAQRTARSDTRMLEAAISLIIEWGAGKTTLKEIGELAGYSRGLAGYRFGSKEGLLNFVVRSIGEDWLQELKQVTAGKAGYEAICAATDAHFRFCVEAPDHVRAFYILWFESINPGAGGKDVIAGIHNRRKRDVIAWINAAIDKDLIDAAVDADVAASQFCSALVGIVYQWLMQPEAMDEIRQLHEGLKQSMALILGLKIENA